MKHIELEEIERELRKAQWKATAEKAKRILAEDAQKAVMAEIRALRNKNEDAKQLLKEAQHNLHMCNGVFVPSNDKANKYIADLCRMIEEILNE